ncbi:alpha/beta hydrolase [Frigoribacterium sp. CFBP 13605]|nr:alpha/beta hydrolase [Frigoribacterium sp. CFBP 13605]
MTTAPILLFLHGVGKGDKDDNWRVTLSKTLEQLGYPALEDARIIAPKYAHALKDWDVKEDIPDVTLKAPARDAARQNRRAFEARMGAIESRLGRHERGQGIPGLDAAVGVGIAAPFFQQAHNYLTRPQIRAQVLNRILASLPASGRLVIVGHSLGSVIAADLLRRLPAGLEVAGMVTIGSPLANGAFDVDKLKETLREPPTSLSWWVNFWNVSDPIAAHRGLSSVIPWLVDFRIETTKDLIQGHLAKEYLQSEAVGTAIGFALHGSASREVSIRELGVDVPLDPAESLVMLALRYAHLMRHQLKGDELDRFTGAVRRVQADAVQEIVVRNQEAGKSVPGEVTRLAFDASDITAPLVEPLPSRHRTKEDAVVLLTVLAAENVIRPYEIDLPRDKWQAAMKDLTAEMGLGSQYGLDVFEAAKEARTELTPGRGVNWIKWGALSVGAAALVVATGGLALAAAPGLAGAAALTSALATFGPGGMIGGLLTAGTLVSAGGGGIAYGLAGQGTSADTLEAVVERRLAATMLRQRQKLEPDPAVWGILTQIEREVRREYERMDEFSDEASPGIKELKRKIVTVELALRYLSAKGLEPGLNPDRETP